MTKVIYVEYLFYSIFNLFLNFVNSKLPIQIQLIYIQYFIYKYLKNIPKINGNRTTYDKIIIHKYLEPKNIQLQHFPEIYARKTRNIDPYTKMSFPTCFFRIQYFVGVKCYINTHFSDFQLTQTDCPKRGRIPKINSTEF